jgi:hypothetical protein
VTRSSASWNELQTRWASGETLSPAEEQRRVREAAEDPLRARELAFFAELSTRAAAPATPPHELVANVLSESSARAHLRVVTPLPIAPSPRSGMRRVALAVAASFALALVLVAVSWLPSDDVARAPARAAATPTALATVALRFVDGDVFRGSAPAVPGPLGAQDVIATEEGRACLEIEPRIEVCAGAHSRVAFESLGTDHVKVRVERGVLIARLTQRAPGQLFSLVSGDVTATARGTTFSLSHDATGVVNVAVLEGRVGVRRGGGAETLLEAERTLSLAPLAEGTSSALDHNERAVLDRLFDREQTAPLPKATPAVEKRESPPPSAAGLLESARRELERGNARAAHTLYERLRASYPASPEARTVLVTMGKLELDLGRPERALASFDAYLAAGGALALEAQSGKIRALRALGRADGEARAIREYLARFPNGFEAPALTRRLAALSAP